MFLPHSLEAFYSNFFTFFAYERCLLKYLKNIEFLKFNEVSFAGFFFFQVTRTLKICKLESPCVFHFAACFDYLVSD